MTEAIHIHELDLVGLQCPVPIIQLMKELGRLEAGATVRARATDLAFEADVAAWCRRTGNELVSCRREEGAITAIVKKA